MKNSKGTRKWLKMIRKKKKNGDQIKKDIKQMKKGIGLIEKVTKTKVFKKVMKVFNKAESAADKGEKIAEASKETVKELNTAKKKFVAECMKRYKKDENFRGACEMEWVNQIGKGNSDHIAKIADKAFKKIFDDEIPPFLCKRLEKCSKEMEKQ